MKCGCIYATAKNTPAVRSGHSMSGYLKTECADCKAKRANPFYPYQMPKLTVELVPSPLWGDNLRRLLSADSWSRLSKACYLRADNLCEICGRKGNRHPVECHEIWEYDDKTRIQTLKGVTSLCPACHRVKHIGFALSKGEATFSKAVSHLAKVNEWPIGLALDYVERQFQIHSIRSQLKWTSDMSWVDDFEQYIRDSEAIGREQRGKRLSAMLNKMQRND